MENIKNAIPVIRNNTLCNNLLEEIENIKNLDRGAILKINFTEPQEKFNLIKNILSSIKDISVYIDMGWTKDFLSMQVWASGIIKFFTDNYPDIELVVAGSSFPDKFSDINTYGYLDIQERNIYTDLGSVDKGYNLRFSGIN